MLTSVATFSLLHFVIFLSLCYPVLITIITVRLIVINILRRLFVDKQLYDSVDMWIVIFIIYYLLLSSGGKSRVNISFFSKGDKCGATPAVGITYSTPGWVGVSFDHSGNKKPVFAIEHMCYSLN